jgi:hypothetical protein
MPQRLSGKAIKNILVCFEMFFKKGHTPGALVKHTKNRNKA